MKRRLRYFLVPCLMLVILGLGFWLFLCHQFANSYRTATNSETAALIGNILEAAPEFDREELIQILRDNSFLILKQLSSAMRFWSNMAIFRPTMPARMLRTSLFGFVWLAGLSLQYSQLS